MLEYWRERFPLRLYGPLAIALAWPAQARLSGTAEQFIVDAAFALLLLAQFRLWDDLADRSVDAERHPDRVLARTEHPARYVALCVTLAVANVGLAVLRDGTALALSVLIISSALVGVGYVQGEHRSPARDLLRLVKYPAFVLIVAAGRPDVSQATVFLAAASAYAAACAYEVWHDPATPLRLLIRSSR